MESFNPGEIIPHCFHANGYGAEHLVFTCPRISKDFPVDSALTLDMEKLSDPQALISSMTSSMPTLPTPPVPGGAALGLPGQSENSAEQWEDFKTSMETFWERQRNMAMASVKTTRDWFDSFFEWHI